MTEQEYKESDLKILRKKNTALDYICIETEETCPGFPDVIVTDRSLFDPVSFIEYKVSDENGVINFQRSQPLFYLKHKHLDVLIVALNKKTGERVSFSKDMLFDPASKFYLDGLKVRLQ